MTIITCTTATLRAFDVDARERIRTARETCDELRKAGKRLTKLFHFERGGISLRRVIDMNPGLDLYVVTFNRAEKFSHSMAVVGGRLVDTDYGPMNRLVKVAYVVEESR